MVSTQLHLLIRENHQRRKWETPSPSFKQIQANFSFTATPTNPSFFLLFSVLIRYCLSSLPTLLGFGDLGNKVWITLCCQREWHRTLQTQKPTVFLAFFLSFVDKGTEEALAQNQQQQKKQKTHYLLLIKAFQNKNPNRVWNFQQPKQRKELPPKRKKVTKNNSRDLTSEMASCCWFQVVGTYDDIPLWPKRVAWLVFQKTKPSRENGKREGVDDIPLWPKWIAWLVSQKTKPSQENGKREGVDDIPLWPKWIAWLVSQKNKNLTWKGQKRGSS